MQKDKLRCSWCLGSQIYIDYHDHEWGVPVHDDRLLFEFLVLETFQAGLSWITVLKKREAFRRAFHFFDPYKIINYSDSDISRLMSDEGIIRNKLKIFATIQNAKMYLSIVAEYGSFDKFIWKFTGHKSIINRPASLSDLPSTTIESDAMSRELKKLGFKFTGSTVCYAFMQATGMVDDHLKDCFLKKNRSSR